jgi:hypothetical protein
MTMKMPKILSCEMTACSFNTGNECHALAITVGSGCPRCDTSFLASDKGGVADTIGSVGACKEETCKYNFSLECTASAIKVALHLDHPDCITFTNRT